MACDGAYASAWAFAAFWCIESLIAGSDDSGGAGNASLQDSDVNFVSLGVEAGKGMILYNTTQGTSAPVTAATATTLTATGVMWDDGDAYRIVTLTEAERAVVEQYLNMTAANIHAAIAQTGGCDCTPASWASSGNMDGADFLGKLNIVEAGVFYKCTCVGPSLTEEQRRTWLEWSDRQLTLLREGEIDICDGATGINYPSFGWAAQGLTARNEAKIIRNRIARTSS